MIRRGCQQERVPFCIPKSLESSQNNWLDKFYADAKAGTLPQVSYIIGPTELSEHPPYSPRDGAWLQTQIVDAVARGKAYNKTVLIISFNGTISFPRNGLL